MDPPTPSTSTESSLDSFEEKKIKMEVNDLEERGEKEELMDSSYFESDGERSNESVIVLSSDDSSEAASDDDDELGFGFGPETMEQPNAFLLKDVEMAQTEFGMLSSAIDRLPSAQIYDIAPTTCTVALRVSTTGIEASLREKWGLEKEFVEVLITEVDKCRFRNLMSGVLMPRVDVPVAFRNCVVTHQIANLVRRSLCSVYVLNGEENMDPSNHGTGSLFALLLRQMTDRLASLTEYCMICNDPLPAAGLLPSICVKDLCTYQYHDLKLYNGITSPRVTPEVLHLLLTFAEKANETAMGSRERRQAMRPDPMPAIPALLNPESHLAEREKEGLKDADIGRGPCAWTDQEILRHMIYSVPCCREILASPAAYARFRETQPRAASLLEWLVISLPAYIHQVPESMNVKSFECHNQFVILADTPAKHRRFHELRVKHGGHTQFLFHGSPCSNWHSILRSGIANYSSTEFQIHGASYGKGIYLSNRLSDSYFYATSRSYGCRVSESSNEQGDVCAGQCCSGKRLLPPPHSSNAIVAVCEVIPSGLKDSGNGCFFTVQDADYVCVRMLLVFTTGTCLSAGAPSNVVGPGGLMRVLPAMASISDADAQQIRAVLEAFTSKGSFQDRVKLLDQVAPTAQQ